MGANNEEQGGGGCCGNCAPSVVEDERTVSLSGDEVQTVEEVIARKKTDGLTLAMIDYSVDGMHNSREQLTGERMLNSFLAMRDIMQMVELSINATLIFR